MKKADREARETRMRETAVESHPFGFPLGFARGFGKTGQALFRKVREKGWAPVIFQEVVHSIGTREADCDEQSSFRGQTEWTSIRMPD
jgi:hypothetical protein